MFDDFFCRCGYVCGEYGHALEQLICRLEPSEPMPSKNSIHPETIKNWDSPCIGAVPYAHTTGKSAAGRLHVLCPALEPVETAWQAPSIRFVAQKRGEQQVIQRTKKLYPGIQRYTICLAPTYRAAPSQNPGRFFVRHTQAGLLTEASNAVFLFSGCAAQ